SSTQSLVVVEKRMHASDLAAAKLVEDVQRRDDRRAAAAPAALHPPRQQHPVTQITPLVDERLKLIPRLAHAPEIGFDAPASPKDLALDSHHRRGPLEVRRCHRGEAPDIAPVEGRDQLLDERHTLPRHAYPRSSASRSAAARASSMSLTTRAPPPSLIVGPIPIDGTT